MSRSSRTLWPTAKRLPDVVFRTAASDDLGEIFRFSMRKFGRDVAKDYLAGLQATIARLGGHPEMGPAQTGLTPSMRAIPYRSHRVFYTLEDDTVFVIRILHHAMDAASRLGN